jgi:type IV pilus assembly protein PilN
MIKINLLPRKIRKEPRGGFGWLLFVLILLLNVGVLFLFYQKNVKDMSGYRRDVDEKKQLVAQSGKIRSEYKTLKAGRDELERKLNVITNLKRGRALSARILNDLPMMIKDSVWLKSFRKTEEQFEMDGRSVENDSISDLVDTMGRIPYIKNVELKKVEDVNEGGITVKRFLIQGNMSL